MARLRDVVLGIAYLDDPGLGVLGVEATLEHAEGGGMLYGLVVSDGQGNRLVSARAGIALP